MCIRDRDYIKNPKPSGYRSLHLIVRVPIFLQNEKCFMKVEVQLRTIAMDFWASLEHKLRYKKEIPEFEKDSLQKELFECAQMINTLAVSYTHLDVYKRQNIQCEREEKTQNDLSAVFSHLWNQEHERQKAVMEQSGRVSETARQLAVSAQAHLTRRDSTDGMSIMAGFPFFGDWGRDTMIAFYGCTLAIGQMEAAKSILQTFMRYCRRGIMPNLFPEGKDEVMYNTVDASLLFINALWEYLQHVTEKECDPSFEAEAIKTAESIISWYKKGTDYNIHMEEDGLLAAGNGLWQLTWMDCLLYTSRCV